MTSVISHDTALLVLEDGRVFRGRPFGAIGASLGEVVFCTTIPSCTCVQQLATSLGIGRGSLALPAATFTKQARHLPPLPFRDV